MSKDLLKNDRILFDYLLLEQNSTGKLKKNSDFDTLPSVVLLRLFLFFFPWKGGGASYRGGDKYRK